jgi:hypothetical protein
VTTRKIIIVVVSTAGSYAGWALGAPVGIFTAFIVSIFGTAAGVVVGRKLADRIEE